jgi:Translation initiation factor eIF3 subunit
VQLFVTNGAVETFFIMGWDDSSSDSDLEAKIQQKLDKHKKTVGKDSSDEEISSKPAPAAPKPAAKKPASSSTPSVLVKEYDLDEIEQSDPAAEKARKQRLEMRGEMQAADDLFSGFGSVSAFDANNSKVREITKIIEKDTFAEMQLKSSKDLEFFISQVASKLKQSKVKSALYTFMKDILRSNSDALEPAECATLAKQLTELEKSKKRAQVDKMQAKKKGYGDVDSIKLGSKIDIDAEMDDVYGDDY